MLSISIVSLNNKNGKFEEKENSNRSQFKYWFLFLENISCGKICVRVQLVDSVTSLVELL
jgi:hypothetical protein